MTLLTALSWLVFGTLAVVCLTALGAWWAKRRWDYEGPTLLERREREGIQVWRSR